MGEKYNLQLHSINATLLMIFGAITSLGDPNSDLHNFGSLCMAFGILTKVVIWLMLLVFNFRISLTPDKEPPQLDSPPLDVD